jgi:cytosolic carboxypeptidase protein 6
MNRILSFLLFLALYTEGSSQTPTPKFEGQAPIADIVDTKNHAIARQWRVKQDVGGVTFDNDFDGARLNSIKQENDSLFTAVIEAENYPINPSPWYAFKVSAEKPRTIWVHLTYLNAKHRYFPKISTDGITWKAVDSADCRLVKDTTTQARNFQDNALSESAFVRIKVGMQPVWIAAQEVVNSTNVDEWTKTLTKKAFVSSEKIGLTTQKRPISCLRIGTDSSEAKIMIVIGRLHPPEVTGQLALQTFVETLCGDSEMAQQFRKKYTLFVVPMMNPDGVDNGHWRHNGGGVDLNRDWAAFIQPETQIIRDFLRKKMENPKKKLYFGIDFHSTWDDIFYTNITGKPTNMDGLIKNWFKELEAAIPDYKVNAKGSKILPGVISKAFFNREFNAEALVYEVGDNTPRDFTALKSRVAAEKLMALALKYLEE